MNAGKRCPWTRREGSRERYKQEFRRIEAELTEFWSAELRKSDLEGTHLKITFVRNSDDERGQTVPMETTGRLQGTL
jgi:hypothetical protein